MKWVIFLLSVAYGLVCQSQVLLRPSSVAYTGNSAYSSHPTNAFSVAANTASLAQAEITTIGLFTERKFMLQAFNHFNAAMALVTSRGNFGLKADYYGYTIYNESQLGLSYARQLGKKVNTGVEFTYNNINIAGYGKASAIGFSIGSLFHLSDALLMGIQVNNPAGGKFGKSEQKLPASYVMGVGYEASENVFINLEIVKEEDQPVNANAGIQYKPVPQLLVNAGVQTANSSIWTGIGFLKNSYRFDIIIHYHPQLGISPGLLVLYQFKKKED